MDARDLDASLSVHMMKVGGDLAPSFIPLPHLGSAINNYILTPVLRKTLLGIAEYTTILSSCICL